MLSAWVMDLKPGARTRTIPTHADSLAGFWLCCCFDRSACIHARMHMHAYALFPRVPGL